MRMFANKVESPCSYQDVLIVSPRQVSRWVCRAVTQQPPRCRPVRPWRRESSPADASRISGTENKKLPGHDYAAVTPASVPRRAFGPAGLLPSSSKCLAVVNAGCARTPPPDRLHNESGSDADFRPTSVMPSFAYVVRNCRLSRVSDSLFPVVAAPRRWLRASEGPTGYSAPMSSASPRKAHRRVLPRPRL